MRIAQIIDSLKIGGAQKLQVTFAQEAKRRGLEVLIISLQDQPDSPFLEELQRLHVEVLTLPASKVLSPSRLLRLREILRSFRIDVVHTHLTSANITGVIAAAITGLPAVATLHTAGLDPRFHKKSRRMLESFLLRFGAARVVGVGQAVADANQKRVGKKPIRVISNAVPSIPSLNEGARSKLRQQICGDSTRPLLITVGRLSAPKGYPDLLDAMALLRNRCPEAALAIVGDGVLRSDLEETISASGLKRNVILLGERSDVPRLLAASDIYVCSSHWEGLPVSILEAMAAGLPVISTSVGAIPDVITEATGILVPPAQPASLADAMSSLLADRETAREMGEAGRLHVSRVFGPEKWLDQWIQLYAELSSAPAVVWEEAQS